jgi:hypothetical protein
VADRSWYGSADFNNYRKPAGIDHYLASVYEGSTAGAIAVITLNRELGGRDFSPREVQLLHFFHE